MSAPVIVTEGLTRHFGPTRAVQDLTLTVNAGEVFGLLGHNGAGKTTTVRLLNGVLGPTSGHAQVLGLSPVTQGSALRRRTGVLTETPSIYENFSARENLLLFADLYDVPRAEAQRRVADLLARFDLADRAHEKAGGFSKGMKQRLALARAFIHQPDILFLDEPTAGLDPVAAKEVNDLITHISRDEGRTVLLATHHLHDAQRLCARVAILEHGHVVAQGSPQALAQRYGQAQPLEIEVDAAYAARAVALLQTHAAQVARSGAVITVAASREQIPALTAALAGAGIPVYRVTPGEPTLEDVYFALHADSAKGGTR